MANDKNQSNQNGRGAKPGVTVVPSKPTSASTAATAPDDGASQVAKAPRKPRAPRGPSKPPVNAKDFVAAWIEVARARGNLDQLAVKLNTPRAQARMRMHKLIDAGVKLPPLLDSKLRTPVASLNAMIEAAGLPAFEATEAPAQTATQVAAPTGEAKA